MGRGRGMPKKNKASSPSILTTLLQQSFRKDDLERGSIMDTESNSVKSCDEKKETLEVKFSKTPAVVNVESETKENIDVPTPKLWIDIISGNKIPSNGATIEFVSPSIVEGEIEVDIEEADIEFEVKLWDSALIMYVIWKHLSMNAVKQYMIKFRNFVKLPYLYYNEEGYFILKLKSHQEKDFVVMRVLIPYKICLWSLRIGLLILI
ncbi:unnamed protein product [Lathyrus sativus]|nr:unnamed protein product [Lathyrus sativus]